MGKKEEITDLISDEGIKHFKVGEVLKFDYEGSPISIKITKKDTKNMRIWGEHITLVNMDKGLSHYGHDIDQKPEPPFCLDCLVPVSDFATQKGDRKAWDRDSKKMQKLTGKKHR